MKVIKTTLGWEIQPENKDEETRLHWLVDCLKAFGAFTSVSRDNECPKCGRATLSLNDSSRYCLACGHRFIVASVEIGEPVRTFTTKGPIG